MAGLLSGHAAAEAGNPVNVIARTPLRHKEPGSRRE